MSANRRILEKLQRKSLNIVKKVYAVYRGPHYKKNFLKRQNYTVLNQGEYLLSCYKTSPFYVRKG